MSEDVCVVIIGTVAELFFYLWAVRTAVGDVCVQLLVLDRQQLGMPIWWPLYACQSAQLFRAPR